MRAFRLVVSFAAMLSACTYLAGDPQAEEATCGKQNVYSCDCWDYASLMTVETPAACGASKAQAEEAAGDWCTDHIEDDCACDCSECLEEVLGNCGEQLVR